MKQQSGERKRVTQQVFLDEKDMEAIDGMVELGAQVTLQSLPDQSPMDVAAIKRAYGA